MRIVSLAPSNTEILYALGCGAQIVANTRYCDYPDDAKKKQKVGGWLDIKEEQVKQMHPDVIMTSTFVQDKIVDHYQKLGIRVFHTDPKTLDDVYRSIFSIGELVSQRVRAARFIEKMKTEFATIRSRTFKSTKVKVYCEEWHDPPTVSGNWVPKIIEIAGGISLCPEGKVSYPVTAKEVEKFDPDCIILSLCGFGRKAKADIVTKREGWENLRAVREREVFVIDDSLLNRPGPRLVEGAKELARIFGEVVK